MSSTPCAGEAPVAILACPDLVGDDADGIVERLRSSLPETPIEIVADLCEKPLAAVPALRRIGSRRAVLALCHNHVAREELQAVARLSALDLYGVAAVRVPLTRGPDLAARTIVAAARRLVLTPAGEPFRLELRSGKLTRRALFQLAPAVTARPVAAVDANRCLGLQRCGLCRDSCPVDAIDDGDGRASVHSSACTACGRCIGACPVDAIHIAGATTAQIEAELGTLLDEPPAGLILACTRAASALPQAPEEIDDWALVELPALALVTPGWILQLVAHGVAAIRLLPCTHECCAPWREGGDAHDLCLHRLPDAISARIAVADRPGAPEAPRLAARRPASGLPLVLDEPVATVSALEALGTAVRTSHPGSPLGLVEIGEGCTLCAACSVSCPTAALSSTIVDDGAVLSFDPRLCVGCRLCSAACPENVLRVERALDTRELASGRRELAHAVIRRCARCDELLPPQPSVVRARNALADLWPALANSQSDLCLACAAAERPLPQRDGLQATTLTRKPTTRGPQEEAP